MFYMERRTGYDILPETPVFRMYRMCDDYDDIHSTIEREEDILGEQSS